MTEPTPGDPDAEVAPCAPASRPSATGQGFGEPGGPDPSAAGKLGGKAKAGRVSFAKALQGHLEAHPEDLRRMVAGLVEVGAAGRGGSVEACKVVLDRLDGPVSLGLDAMIGSDRVVLLRVDASGTPLKGYDQAPQLPPGLEEMATPESLSREAFELAREAEVVEETEAERAPRAAPVRSRRPPTPEELIAIGETRISAASAIQARSTHSVPVDCDPIPSPIPAGWRPTKAQAAELARRERLREAESEGPG